MEKYKHMAYSVSAERHFGPDATGSFPMAMLFALAGDAVVDMDEQRWPDLVFPTNGDAADFADLQCRKAIDRSARALAPGKASAELATF